MKKIFVYIIHFYKKAISPFLSTKGIHCKYYPTCSEYMRQAIIKYGCIKRYIFRNKKIFKV